MLVDDLDDGGRHDLPHRAGPLDRLALRHDAVGRPGLGHAVIVGDERSGHLGLQTLDDVGRQRRAADRAHLHGRHVDLGEAGMVDQQVRHGRDEEHGDGVLLLHHAQPAVGVEARLVDDLQAELHRGVHQCDAGEGEQGAGVQPAAAGPVRLDGTDHGPVGVADRHPLGPAGGARGVEDVGQVVGLARGLEGRAVAGGGLGPPEDRARRGRARPGPVLRAGVDQDDEAATPGLEVARDQVAVGDDGGGARVGQHVGHLGRGQAGVHGHRHPAGPVGRGVGHEPGQGELVVQVDADAATRLEARLEEPTRQGVGGAVPLGEGHGPHVDDREGGAVAELGGHAGQMVVHQHERYGW